MSKTILFHGLEVEPRHGESLARAYDRKRAEIIAEKQANVALVKELPEPDPMIKVVGMGGRFPTKLSSPGIFNVRVVGKLQ